VEKNKRKMYKQEIHVRNKNIRDESCMLLPLLNFSKNFPEIDGWIPFFLFVCVLFFFTFYIYSRNKSESRIEQGSAAAAGAIGSAEHFWEQQTVTVSLNNIPFPLSQNAIQFNAILRFTTRQKLRGAGFVRKEIYQT
jgi:hypothetical protein